MTLYVHTAPAGEASQDIKNPRERKGLVDAAAVIGLKSI